MKENKILEEVKRIDAYYQNKINGKENQIQILKAEIEQLYDVINSIQRLSELVNEELCEE